MDKTAYKDRRIDNNHTHQPDRKKDADSVLGRALKNAETIITKSYLERLDQYALSDLSSEKETIDIARHGRLYRLKRLVFDQEENILDKLITVVNVVSAIDSSLTVVIQSDGIKTAYYLGIISKKYQNDPDRAAANQEAFYGALTGNLQGIELEEIKNETDMDAWKKAAFAGKSCCSISGIAARRDEEGPGKNRYVQGIENLVDSLKGRRYTILLIADPVRTDRVQEMRQGYELLHTQLSKYSGYTMTYSENDTVSLSESGTHSVSAGISKGIALTQGTAEAKGWSVSDSIGYYAGGSAGVSIGIKDTADVNLGMNAGTNKSRSAANNASHTVSKSQTKSENWSSQSGYAKTDSVSNAKMSGASLQFGVENRNVKSLLDKIDKHLERLDACESFGAFECAAYVIADRKEDALTAAANYYALMRGKDSGIQTSHIHLWDGNEKAGQIKRYLKAFVHPRFCMNEKESYGERILVTPASVIGGYELALQIGLPRKSVNGMMVAPMAPFGRNVPDTSDNNSLYLGKLHHMGHDENYTSIRIQMRELCKHAFITGSTGTGKSTAIYSILDQLMEHSAGSSGSGKISFMVIEPVKGEYKERFGSYENVSVFGTNSKKTPLIRLNPFSFPDDVHVLEHIDRLIEIFNVCWPMYAAMPAVLKDAVEEAYIAAGWDLGLSVCGYTDQRGRKFYPSFADVLNKIRDVMERSEYSADSKGDYKGALCTRLKSLTNGLYQHIFTCDEISAEKLFDENVIIDLSRTGSAETKALIMGLLVMKLQEYRMSSASGSNQALRHVTVLEEAHHILKRTSFDQGMESANLIGKSVEMLSNSIAEMRTYGEGFLIVDQAPGLMDPSAIRNTGTKIILRLPELSDRELAGSAAGLQENQILELAKLDNFVAAVHQNGWKEPVLCRMAGNAVLHKAYTYVPKELDNESMPIEKYIEYLSMDYKGRIKLSMEYKYQIKDGIWRQPISTESKIAFLKYMDASNKEEKRRYAAKALYGIFNSESALPPLKNTKGSVDLPCYHNIVKKLKPDITFLSEQAQEWVVWLLLCERENMGGEKLLMEFFKDRSDSLSNRKMEDM